MPPARKRHGIFLTRKHVEYDEIVAQHFNDGARRDEQLMHQIAIDVPRTAPDVITFRNPLIRESIARILYCWSIRRPASGYVQGINDILVPIFDVMLSEYRNRNLDRHPQETCNNNNSSETNNTLEENVMELSVDAFKAAEADSFWCFSKLLDSLQDNYTYNQAGITRQMARLREIISRIYPQLQFHLDKEGVSMMQFAFRWMNCLLVREFPLCMVIRMWDTYMAEGESAFTEFHTYVCAAFLAGWCNQIFSLDFQGIIQFLQNPPTKKWTIEDLEVLLSEAYVLKTLFSGSPKHLESST